MDKDRVRVRIAPSPTGNCHVGTARNSLYNLLFARKYNGRFILRLEDTDVKRSTRESEEGVYEALRWLGLHWDEGPDVGGPFGPYRQSERLPIYRECAEQLLAEGKAYRCYCTPGELDAERKAAQAAGRPPRYSGRCQNLSERERQELLAQGRKPAIRFRVERQMASFRDLVRGELTEDAGLYGDFIILKSDGYPVYNFAVVVDDHLMEISQVLRSAEHIANTFRQALIFRALGFELPQFAHFPLLLNPDRSKISKRYGAVYIGDFRDQGYLKEALLNFLALLGWNPGTDQEIFSMEELIQEFSLERVSASDAIFDRQKLDWMNGYYIRSLTVPEVTRRIMPFLLEDITASMAASLQEIGRKSLQAITASQQEIMRKPLEDITASMAASLQEIGRKPLEDMVALERERMKLLSEAPQLLEFFLVEDVEHDPTLFASKAHSLHQIVEALKMARERLQALPAWTEEAVEKSLRGLAEELGWKAGDLFMPVRVAVTGRCAAPPLFATMRVIGRERCLARLAAAQGKLAAAASPQTNSGGKP